LENPKILKDMTIRVAEKILKNQETLKYHKYQIRKAETVVRKYLKNKKEEASSSEA
jgi:hypothetical protein